MRSGYYLLLTLVFLPLSSAYAAPSNGARSASAPACVTNANGNCIQRVSSPGVDPCKSGNCGLEYRARGSSGKPRSVLKMNMKRGGGGRGRRGGYRRGGGGRFHFRR